MISAPKIKNKNPAMILFLLFFNTNPNINEANNTIKITLSIPKSNVNIAIIMTVIVVDI